MHYVFKIYGFRNSEAFFYGFFKVGEGLAPPEKDHFLLNAGQRKVACVFLFYARRLLVFWRFI